ncbi:hypothetical protein Pcac1_g27042 [Phytophthora cactorum]|uniref:Major facilitator superfamily (MFS) profile domain-containing protein n=1 Tax=Phytophthora cactorum TaxID=29920 RepID=A0A8T1FZT1_9STRA|nr:hypothetical protein Pcac1_g27042 [Phytophthora cactorum]KAG2981589.1 hypothetical protein PC118_g10523 [Phytophthora cactorum]KAG3107822.1 hypothetical protein PI125_g12373 [Phytophthora idaei]KAG3167318.1 hypothetical protein C6341_g11755 [Phytophthora cactorum]KAG3242288.1 hypothetical protein PI124_g12873 [Phytophthora idaei]
MQHSQSDVALGTNGSWADLKIAEGLKKRSNTAQNLQFYVEEQKRLYQELPFSVLPGMRRQSFQRERSFSNLKSRSSWGSFTNLVARGEDQPLLGADDEFPEPGYTFPLLLSCGVALMSAFQFGYNTGVTGGINPDIIFPESPRWLLTKNRPKEAADILRRLRGSNDVYEEIDSICSASDNESGANTGIWDVLKDRSIRFPLVAAVVLQVAQQFSGINAVMFYASSFFKNVGLKDPLVGATLVYTVNVISTGVALVLMDTAGRRPLLIYSAIGMIISSIVLTLGLMNALPFASMASVGGVMCFVWFFEIGLGPIPWLIVAEMFPAKPRPTAMSIATMVNWSCSFLVGLTFPTMQRELGEYTFVPFCAALCLALAFTLKYVPETKGKTIQEIQDELRLKKKQSMEV